MSKILNIFLIFLFSLTVISCASSSDGGSSTTTSEDDTNSEDDTTSPTLKRMDALNGSLSMLYWDRKPSETSTYNPFLTPFFTSFSVRH